jgi:hypothetical protein
MLWNRLLLAISTSYIEKIRRSMVQSRRTTGVLGSSHFPGVVVDVLRAGSRIGVLADVKRAPK